MQNLPNLDKPIPVNSVVLHRIFKALHFSDKLKPLRNGPFKKLNKPREVTHKLLTQDRKRFNTHRNLLVPHYPKEPLLFPHIESNNEQKSETFYDSDTSDIIQYDPCTS